VAARYREMHLVLLPLGMEHEGHAAFQQLQVLAHEVRSGRIEAVADDLLRDRLGQRPRLRVIQVEHGLARRQQEARKKPPELHHLLVIKAHVSQHRDLGPVERDRPVAFVDLADKQFRVADECRSEGRVRRNEILHHRTVHHRRLAM